MLCSHDAWDAKLVVLGTGSEVDYWKSCLRQRGCGDSFEFLGFRSDVPELMQAADCLISPARHEAHELGVHEAISSRIPAFVSSGAGVAERYPIHF